MISCWGGGNRPPVASTSRQTAPALPAEKPGGSHKARFAPEHAQRASLPAAASWGGRGKHPRFVVLFQMWMSAGRPHPSAIQVAVRMCLAGTAAPAPLVTSPAPRGPVVWVRFPRRAVGVGGWQGWAGFGGGEEVEPLPRKLDCPVGAQPSVTEESPAGHLWPLTLEWGPWKWGFVGCFLCALCRRG